jgi:endonuclease/exonuclease/phosphatase family metal-dependent hydrolase
MSRHLVVTFVLLAGLAGLLVAFAGCPATGDLGAPPPAAKGPAGPSTPGPSVPGPSAGPDTTLAGSRGPVAAPTDLGAFVAEPIRYRSQGLRVAAFNVEFLFDGVDPEGQADFPWKGDPAAARNHRDGVARIIRTLDADVLMLQEIENLEVLEMMIAESLSDMGYRAYYVRGRDTFTRQDIGLLSRIPVNEVGRTDERAPVAGGREDYGVSKNLWARLDLGGVPTTLISVHFLSQPDNRQRQPQREAQAAVIRRLADAEFVAGREVIVLGDFNDFDPDTPDRRNSAPITNVLATLKGAGPGLRNVMAEVPQQRRFTAFWDRNRNRRVEEGELSAIDHLLVSPRFHRALVEVTFAHAHDPAHGPDHFPIVATFDPARLRAEN